MESWSLVPVEKRDRLHLTDARVDAAFGASPEALISARQALLGREDGGRVTQALLSPDHLGAGLESHPLRLLGSLPVNVFGNATMRDF